MGRITTRKAVFLCLIVLLQECGPAHFVEINPAVQKIQEDDQDEFTDPDFVDEELAEEEDLEDDSSDFSLEHVPSRRKRGISWVIKVIKVLKKANAIFGHVASGAFFADAIYNAIAGCCGGYPKACEASKEMGKLNNEAERKREIAEAIHLEVQNTQAEIQILLRTFNSVVLQMNRIQNAQDAFLAVLAPNLKVKLLEEDKKVEEFIRKREKNKHTAEYIEVVDMYFSTIQNAAAVTYAGLSAAIPIATKIYAKCKANQAGKSTEKAAVKSKSGKLNLPSRSNPRYKAIRLGRFAATIRRTNIANVKLQQTSTTKVQKANKFGKKLAKGLGQAFSAIVSGFKIYFIIRNWKSCEQKSKRAIQSRDQMKGIVNGMDESIKNITSAKALLKQTFKAFHANLAGETFSDQLKYIKGFASDMQVAGNDMTQVAADIQYYMDNIKAKTTVKHTQNLLEKLLNALLKVSTPVNCYRKELEVMRIVAEKCQKGQDSFATLYADQKALHAAGSDKMNCGSAIGTKFISESALRRGVVKIAEKLKFNIDCQANNPTKQRLVCKMKSRGASCKTMARRLRISESTVKAIAKSCALDEGEVCEFKEIYVDDYPNTWAQELAVEFMVTEERIKKIVCN